MELMDLSNVVIICGVIGGMLKFTYSRLDKKFDLMERKFETTDKKIETNRQELGAALGLFRQELKEDLNLVRQELKEEIGEVKKTVDRIDFKVSDINIRTTIVETRMEERAPLRNPTIAVARPRGRPPKQIANK